MVVAKVQYPCLVSPVSAAALPERPSKLLVDFPALANLCIALAPHCTGTLKEDMITDAATLRGEIDQFGLAPDRTDIHNTLYRVFSRLVRIAQLNRTLVIALEEKTGTTGMTSTAVKYYSERTK